MPVKLRMAKKSSEPSHSECTRSAILFYFHLFSISLSDCFNINLFTITHDMTCLLHSEWPKSLQRPNHSECTRPAILFYFHLFLILLSDYFNIYLFTLIPWLDISCLLHPDRLRSLQRPSHFECTRSPIFFLLLLIVNLT